MLPLLLLGTLAVAAPISRGPYFVNLSSDAARVCWRAGSSATGNACKNLSGLTPNTTFTYTVGATGKHWTARALPEAGQSLRFAAFGDFGQATRAQYAVARALNKWNPTLVLLLGDLVYPKGAEADYDKKYFKPYAKILPRIPFFPAIGNHDYGNYRVRLKKAKRRFREAYERIHQRPRYYSFDAGDVHFVSLDNNYEGYGIAAAAPIRRGSAQWRWLDDDLARSRRKWKVLFLHVPIYTSSKHGDHAALRKALEPLLKKHGVDLVLQGHNHHYERTAQIGAPLYITAGTGGGGLYPIKKKASWSKKILVEYGFVGITVTTQRLRLEFINTEGQTLDSVVLEKP
jgi:predicted phosphodiesterase